MGRIPGRAYRYGGIRDIDGGNQGTGIFPRVKNKAHRLCIMVNGSRIIPGKPRILACFQFELIQRILRGDCHRICLASGSVRFHHKEVHRICKIHCSGGTDDFRPPFRGVGYLASGDGKRGHQRGFGNPKRKRDTHRRWMRGDGFFHIGG